MLTAGQKPVATQLAECVSVPAAQLAARHVVAAVGYVHAVRLLAVHEPAQEVASLAHAARGATGAPTTWLHVPIEPVCWQDSQCPPHALLQHTPSAKVPDWHFVATVAGVPFTSFGAHALPAQ